MNALFTYLILVSSWLLWCCGAMAKEVDGIDCSRQYTFSWSIHEDCESLRPRGGSTKGARVVLDTEPHKSWLALKKPGLGHFEKDRLAILAMAGGYRTSFEFIETLGYVADYKPPRPYQSWATEYVYVLEDRGTFISLQHVMVMVFEDEGGKLSEPMVMKHWRQDWHYEKHRLLEYQGGDTWTSTRYLKAKVKGLWSQAVYQVDDSPRYEALGKWQHNPSFSVWESSLTWRPLPRREHSVRNDYDLLEGKNLHTILPTGWVHEQTNAKVSLQNNKDGSTTKNILAKELGVNRYERVIGHNFVPGDEYWQNTSLYWRDVRKAWMELMYAHDRFTLNNKKKPSMFVPIFEGAKKFSGKHYNKRKSQEYIAKLLAEYVMLSHTL